MPQKQGSGASLRFYSNVRAYLDLGYKPEVIQVASHRDQSFPSEDLRGAEWTSVIEPPSPVSLMGRLMFRAGIPTQAAVSYYREKHLLAYREVQKRIKQEPGALFHSKESFIASVLPWLPKQRARSGACTICRLQSYPPRLALPARRNHEVPRLPNAESFALHAGSNGVWRHHASLGA